MSRSARTISSEVSFKHHPKEKHKYGWQQKGDAWCFSQSMSPPRTKKGKVGILLDAFETSKSRIMFSGPNADHLGMYPPKKKGEPLKIAGSSQFSL